MLSVNLQAMSPSVKLRHDSQQGRLFRPGIRTWRLPALKAVLDRQVPALTRTARLKLDSVSFRSPCLEAVIQPDAELQCYIVICLKMELWAGVAVQRRSLGGYSGPVSQWQVGNRGFLRCTLALASLQYKVLIQNESVAFLQCVVGSQSPALLPRVPFPTTILSARQC